MLKDVGNTHVMNVIDESTVMSVHFFLGFQLMAIDGS